MLYGVILISFPAFASITVLQAMVSRAASEREQGVTMASLTALASVMGIVAPVLGTSLLGQVIDLEPGSVLMGAPFFACSALEAVATVIALRYFSRQRHAPCVAPAGEAA